MKLGSYDLLLRKNGTSWVWYLGGNQLSCGDVDNLIEEMNRLIEYMLKIDYCLKKGEICNSTYEEFDLMNCDLWLRKEGIYWTMYLGEYSLDCGDIEDQIEDMLKIALRLESGEDHNAIIKEYTTFL